MALGTLVEVAVGSCVGVEGIDVCDGSWVWVGCVVLVADGNAEGITEAGIWVVVADTSVAGTSVGVVTKATSLGLIGAGIVSEFVRRSWMA